METARPTTRHPLPSSYNYYVKLLPTRDLAIVTGTTLQVAAVFALYRIQNARVQRTEKRVLILGTSGRAHGTLAHMYTQCGCGRALSGNVRRLKKLGWGVR